METFEQKKFIPPQETSREKPTSENEGILKIQKELKSAEKFPITYDNITERLYPEILNKERQELEKKWPTMPEIDFNDPKFQKRQQDYDRFYQDLGKFIKQKSPQEIFERAQEVYSKHMEQGLKASSGEEVRGNFYEAHEIARRFLPKDAALKASQASLEILWQKINDTKDRKERSALAKTILSLPDYFREAKPKLNFEQRAKVLVSLMAAEPLTEQKQSKLFSHLVSFREIKSKSEAGRKEEKRKVIVGLNFVREAARKEIDYLISNGEKEKACDLANFFEKNKVLDLDRDSDLLDIITAEK